MRILALYDRHGNLEALDAVLGDQRAGLSSATLRIASNGADSHDAPWRSARGPPGSP